MVIVRTYTAISLFAVVTVHAKDLEAFGEVMVNEPLVEFCAIVWSVYLFSMLLAIVVSMVNSQEERFGFSATGTDISPIGEYDLFLQTIVIGQGILSSFVWIVLYPLINLGNDFLFVSLMVLFAILLKILLGLLSPYFSIGISAIPASIPMGFKRIFRFTLMAFGACLHRYIIPQFDYFNHHESVTTIPTGSTLQATGRGSALHLSEMMIWSELTGDCEQPSGGSGTANLSEHIDGNQLGVAGGLIFGLKKTYFNSKNFGSMTIKTYSPAA